MKLVNYCHLCGVKIIDELDRREIEIRSYGHDMNIYMVNVNIAHHNKVHRCDNCREIKIFMGSVFRNKISKLQTKFLHHYKYLEKLMTKHTLKLNEIILNEIFPKDITNLIMCYHHQQV